MKCEEERVLPVIIINVAIHSLFFYVIIVRNRGLPVLEISSFICFRIKY